MASIELLTISLDFAGKILLGVMALLVHEKVTREGRIDLKVLGEMKLEKYFGSLAIVFFVLEFVLKLGII